MSEDKAEKPNPTREVQPPGPIAEPAALTKKEKQKEKKLKLVPPEPPPAVIEERAKVIRLFRRLEEENEKWRIRQRKLPWVFISGLVCVALPVLLASIYYFFIAADRYIAEARFAIRSNETSTVDALGALAGIPSSPTLADSYMVSDYIVSREMVRLLDDQVSLRSIYSDERGDFLTRLNPEVSLEALVAYWNKRVDVLYDPLKTTIVVEVQAFSPGDAAKIVTAILENVRDLVNGISANARRDAMEFAAKELARAEVRLRTARQDVLEFRLAHNDLDPMLSAASTLQLASTLEAERAKLSTQLASLSGYLSEDAPSLQMLKSRMAALQTEVDRLQGQVSQTQPASPGDEAGSETLAGDPPAGAMATEVGKYQELQVNQLFAERAHASALTSLERARGEAERTQSYLAVYLPPKPTDAAAFPNRGVGILVVLVLSTILWSVGLLAISVIRDHA